MEPTLLRGAGTRRESCLNPNFKGFLLYLHFDLLAFNGPHF